MLHGKLSSSCSHPSTVLIKQITSGRRIAQVRKQPPGIFCGTIPGTSARNQSDTRAATICAGANFKCIRPTGLVYQVHGFHKSFDAIPNVPVATVAMTRVNPENGLSCILIIHQALYFGAQMDHSLINVNQIRVTGIPLCDDPFDRYREIGIDTENVQIPFLMDGNTLYFDSRVPTDDELENCPYITLTDDLDWDPTQVNLTDPKPKEINMSTMTWDKWNNQII